MPNALNPLEPPSSELLDLDSIDPHADPALSSCGSPVKPNGLLSASVCSIALRRFAVLAALLSLQSGSQVMMQRYEDLIKTHIVIVLFLSMIVGAGGNAGNQAAVAVITAMLAARQCGRLEQEHSVDRPASPDSGHAQGSPIVRPLFHSAAPSSSGSEADACAMWRRVEVRANSALSARHSSSHCVGIARRLVRWPLVLWCGLRRVLKTQYAATYRKQRGGRQGTLSFVPVLRSEMVIGLCCGFILMLTGGIRVALFLYFDNNAGSAGEGIVVKRPRLLEEASIIAALSLALFCVVMSSVMIGATLPFVLDYFSLNIEHAAPMVQVIVDLIGTWICCVTCHALLPPLPAMPSDGLNK